MLRRDNGLSVEIGGQVPGGYAKLREDRADIGQRRIDVVGVGHGLQFEKRTLKRGHRDDSCHQVTARAGKR